MDVNRVSCNNTTNSNYGSHNVLGMFQYPLFCRGHRTACVCLKITRQQWHMERINALQSLKATVKCRRDVQTVHLNNTWPAIIVLHYLLTESWILDLKARKWRRPVTLSYGTLVTSSYGRLVTSNGTLVTLSYGTLMTLSHGSLHSLPPRPLLTNFHLLTGRLF